MYSFSPKLRLVSIILLVAGLVLFAAGYFMNHGLEDATCEGDGAETKCPWWKKDNFHLSSTVHKLIANDMKTTLAKLG